MEQFDDIRPYRDDEVPGAVQNLLRDTEFLGLVAGFKAPRVARWLSPLARLAVRRWLVREYGGVTSVDQLQSRLAKFVERVVEASTAGITQSGLEQLDPGQSYLFLSNHRDIVFDPMVVNHQLYIHQMPTARIAIGDNLLQNRVFAELMRLNKSFVVRRNLTSAREMRNAFSTLSGFITHSIQDNHNVWIAQREGRAKSGIDRTDPAIIKMFYMSQKKSGMAFSEAMNRLRIVPVSISYEWDPCDLAKARELELRDRTGEYQKEPDEDTHQIVLGLSGFKGKVHVHFGRPVTDSPEKAAELATLIDRDILGHYHLHPSNLAAYGLVEGQSDEAVAKLLPYITATPEQISRARQQLQQRLADAQPALHPYLLANYANPVAEALKVAG